MELTHPLMLLVVLFEKIGLGEFAHNYPHVIYSWFVMLLLIVIGRLAVSKISFVPGKIQNLFEIFINALEEFQVSIMGEKGRPFFPLTATLALYIFFCNIQGIIPGSMAPTTNVNTTLSLALIVFLLTHIVGIKVHGFKYIKHFMGPIIFLAPLMFVIEIISHLSRVLSLTLRLFGNIMGEDLVIAILFVMAGKFFVPMPMMFMALFAGALQTFVFTLLTMLYISGALEDAHVED